MLSSDELEIEEKEIRKKYESKLLAELLYLNYRYKDNKDCYTSSGDFIYKTLNDQLEYNDDEELEIKNNAMKLIKNKYNIKIRNFEKLVYEED